MSPPRPRSGSVRPDGRPTTGRVAAADRGRADPPSRRCLMRSSRSEATVAALASGDRPSVARGIALAKLEHVRHGPSRSGWREVRAACPTASPWLPSKPTPNRRPVTERLRAGRLDGHLLGYLPRISAHRSPTNSGPGPRTARGLNPTGRRHRYRGQTSVVRRRPHPVVVRAFDITGKRHSTAAPSPTTASLVSRLFAGPVVRSRRGRGRQMRQSGRQLHHRKSAGPSWFAAGLEPHPTEHSQPCGTSGGNPRERRRPRAGHLLPSTVLL
jgi:hypothetical protein